MYRSLTVRRPLRGYSCVQLLRCGERGRTDGIRIRSQLFGYRLSRAEATAFAYPSGAVQRPTAMGVLPPAIHIMHTCLTCTVAFRDAVANCCGHRGLDHF